MFRKYRQQKLEKYVRRYFASHQETKLIFVVGSSGTRMTKTMVATLLSQKYRVRMETQNQSSQIEILLSLLGISLPEAYSGAAWRQIFKSAKERCAQPATADVTIQAIDMTAPGILSWLQQIVHPHICVVTSIEQRWVEQFGSPAALTNEVMQFANASGAVIVNRDEVPSDAAQYLTNPNIDTYGSTAAAEYHIEIADAAIANGYQVNIVAPGYPEPLSVHLNVVGQRALRASAAAVAVGTQFGMTNQDIVKSIMLIGPVPGNMNRLRGSQESTVIDCTNNASEQDVEDGLQTLYAAEIPKCIALIGTINGLGSTSAAEHQRLGALCDPDFLEWVVTVGQEANDHFAPAARARGCQVKSFMSPIDAGSFVHEKLHTDSLILAVGSCEAYLEEAIKIFLHTTDEDQELVRQTPEWLAYKNERFTKM